MPRQDPKDPVLATNRKAFHDYHVLDRFEAGIQLLGTEVKSCRARAIQLQEGFIKIENNQALLYNVHIAAYDFGNRFNHQAKQTRRLLLLRGRHRTYKRSGRTPAAYNGVCR